MNGSRKMFFIMQAILAIVICLLAPPAYAQGSGNSVSGSVSRPQTAGATSQLFQPVSEDRAAPLAAPAISDVRIGPDDLLNITVFEAPEMNTALRVSASGDISFPLLGDVHAAGLTPSELQSVLQGLLRRTYMKDPHVGVFIQELQSHSVSVVGAVKMPGVFQIRGPKTLLEILSMAQGLADDAGDTVSIVHEGEESKPDRSAHQDLKFGGTNGIPQRNALLVKTDGTEFADSDRITKVENINLKRLLDSNDSPMNVLVHPGDVVKVSRAGIVYVVGEVNKPGGFVLQNNESISILQALALAQGTTHTSAIGRTRIIRTDAATGKRMEINVNLGKIFSGKRPDVMLEPKDVVFVPNSSAKSVLYKGSAAALQTAAGVAIYKW